MLKGVWQCAELHPSRVPHSALPHTFEHADIPPATASREVEGQSAQRFLPPLSHRQRWPQQLASQSSRVVEVAGKP